MIKHFPINSIQPNRAGLLRSAITRGLPASLQAKFLFIWTGKYDGDNLKSDLPNNAAIQYGNIYNGYAIDDPRGICAEGWHVPTIADFNDLITAVGGAIGNAPKLKASGTEYWRLGNNGTNELKLNLRGSGLRVFGSSYSDFKASCELWTGDTFDFGYPAGIKHSAFQVFNGDDDIYLMISAPGLNQGLSVRLVKDSTLLEDGEEGFYIGNDLRLYKTVCIGGKEWLAEHLTETKYKNGDKISLVLDSSWDSLTTGAYCYYNGMITNSFISSNPDTLIVTNKDWSTKHIPPETLATISIPNDYKYIQADNVYDNFWLDPYFEAPVLNQITHAELIVSETERTFVKYSDFEPYNISAIGILKAGTVLTELDKIYLNKFFKLWVQYWGTTMMDSGYMKDNRTLIEDE